MKKIQILGINFELTEELKTRSVYFKFATKEDAIKAISIGENKISAACNAKMVAAFGEKAFAFVNQGKLSNDGGLKFQKPPFPGGFQYISQIK